MSKLDFNQITTISFDVVGTLIDFESGILNWFRPHLESHGHSFDDELILSLFAQCEDRLQRTAPDKPFTAMLPLIYRDMAASWQLPEDADAGAEFRDSIRSWPAFDDSVAALAELKSRFRLVAVTNADAWALDFMSHTLGDPFDLQITCDAVGVNKPSPRVFEYLLEKLAPLGVSKSGILHTAQSQYHDIVPATELGFATAWIERRQQQAGFGATPEPARLAKPTLHADSMRDFVSQVQALLPLDE